MDFRHPLLIMLLFFASTAWSADALPVIQKHCAGCHGEDGLSVAPGSPHLNGQVDEYLLETMKLFQKGASYSAVPNHIPAELTIADLQAIARHYTAVKAARPKAALDPEKIARGEEVYRTRCADCHLDNGRDVDKNAPLMAAQNVDYLIAQTKLFVSGKRKFGFLQDDAFKGLSPEELEAAANFFASQEQYGVKAGKRKRR